MEFFAITKDKDILQAITAAMKGYERSNGKEANVILINEELPDEIIAGVKIRKWEKMPKGLIGATRMEEG
jgi:hypothetical protein